MGVWKMVWRNWPKYLDGCPVWTAATGLKKANIKIFLCQSDSQCQDNHFEHRKCPKSPLQAQVMMVWKKSAKMPCWLPSLNSFHRPKFKMSAPIKAQVLGIWKKVVAKLGSKWGLPSLNGHHGPNFWIPNSKNFCGHRIENCLKIILGFEIGHS